ncbi:MAG: crossover junction endodeoxyribonuclease RuvC [Bacteroidetes bacterium]|nr:crossover junction endodeoxyribonuclease RuvC [Bacteroidota bacterium]
MNKEQLPYRLLGIDPGTNILGFAVIEVYKGKIKLKEMGVITMNHLTEQQLKLKLIFEKLQKIIDRHQPKEMAIEAPFYGKNVQSMLKLGRAQGVAIAAAITKNVRITEYSPKKIKQSITGNGNASKEQVAAMLTNTLKADLKDQLLDATDALAAAVCHFHQMSGPSLPGRKKYTDWKAYANDNPKRIGKSKKE